MKRRLRNLSTRQKDLKVLNPIMRKVRENLDEKYELVWISQGDGLSDKQVALLLGGEDIFDSKEFADLEEWIDGSRYERAIEVIKEILDDNEFDILDNHPDELDELRFEVTDRDQSDPYTGLVRETRYLLMRYDVDVAVGTDWSSSEQELAEQAEDLANTLGFASDPTVANLIASGLLPEAGYGGHAWILFYASVAQMWEAVQAYHGLRAEDRPHAKITFTTPYLLVLDALNGAGFDLELPVDVTLPFTPQRLTTDAGAPGYSWDDVAGVVKSAYSAEVSFEGLTPTPVEV